jgi:hypothetical protein
MPHAAYGACFEIIRADRKADVVLAGRHAVRDIEASPAVDDPALGPRVAGDRRIALGQVEITTHVPRRDAEIPAARDEHMSMILADTFTRLVRLQCGGMHRGHARFEGQALANRVCEIAQPRERAGAVPILLRELDERPFGARKTGRTQKDER